MSLFEFFDVEASVRTSMWGISLNRSGSHRANKEERANVEIVTVFVWSDSVVSNSLVEVHKRFLLVLFL